jgi:predicted lipoprotein with Yx(FWY)xxD motif
MRNKAIIGIIVAVIIILAGSGYAAYHKSDNNSQDTSATTNSTPETASPQPSANSSTDSASADGGAIVQTKTDSSAGKYLADANGNPLYTYGGDSKGVSNCNGSCLYEWPIYAATKTSGLPANISVITRDDGTKQYAYKGLPLYTFTSDSNGQVTGDNVSDFHIAKP